MPEAREPVRDAHRPQSSGTAFFEAVFLNQGRRCGKPLAMVDDPSDAAPQIGLALTAFRHDQTLSSAAHLPILVLTS